jgi:hypothetical protein
MVNNKMVEVQMGLIPVIYKVSKGAVIPWFSVLNQVSEEYC